MTEIFKVATALRFDVSVSEDDFYGDDWWNRSEESIRSELEDRGYPMDSLIDMDYDDENEILRIYVNLGDSKCIDAYRRPARGYILSVGDWYIPVHQFIETLSKLDVYGCNDFEVGDGFQVSEVIHNDLGDAVLYYLKAFVVTDEPIKLKLPVTE